MTPPNKILNNIGSDSNDIGIPVLMKDLQCITLKKLTIYYNIPIFTA